MTNILRENMFKKPWTHSQFLYLIITGIIRERKGRRRYRRGRRGGVEEK